MESKNNKIGVHICAIFPCGLTYNLHTQLLLVHVQLATKDIYNTADTVNVWVCVNAELMRHGTKQEPCDACCMVAILRTHDTYLICKYPTKLSFQSQWNTLKRGDGGKGGTDCMEGERERSRWVVKPLGHMTLTPIPGLPSKPEAPCVVMEVWVTWTRRD